MRKPEKAGIFGVLVIVVLMFSSADALIVDPSWVEFTGEHDTWQSRNITIINNENRTINVTIEPSSTIADCYISRPSLTLEPYECTNIVLGVQLYDNTHGFILYTYDGQQFNQFVLLTPYGNNVSVEVIPANPNPGGSVVFLLTPYVSGRGFVYVPSSNKLHNFNITYGMAFVTLSPDDYGEAVAVFQGENFQTRKVFRIAGEINETLELIAPDKVIVGDEMVLTLMYGGNPVAGVMINVTEPDGDNYMKMTDDSGKIKIEFDKEGTWRFYAFYNGKEVIKNVLVKSSGSGSGSSGSNQSQVKLTIVAPNEVTIGDKKWITLKANGEVVPNHDINVESPDGYINAYATNQFGQIQFTFDTAGKYKFSATYNGATAQKEITVNKKPVNITVPDKAYVNSYATILAPAGAGIKIQGGKKEISDTIPSSGEYRFTPDKAGKYTVTIESATYKGSASFTVYEQTAIAVYDKNHNRITEGKPNEQYIIYVIDSSGEIVKDIDTVKIKDPSGFPYEVTITETGGVWTPEKAGTYTITVAEQGYYASSSLTVTIVKEGMNILTIVSAFAVLAVILVLIAMRDKVVRIKNVFKRKGEKEGKKEKAEDEVE